METELMTTHQSPVDRIRALPQSVLADAVIDLLCVLEVATAEDVCGCNSNECSICFGRRQWALYRKSLVVDGKARG